MTLRETVDRNILSPIQVADMLGVSRTTASRWIDNGELKGWRIPGSKERRTTRAYVVAFARKHGIPLDLVQEDRATWLIKSAQVWPDVFDAVLQTMGLSETTRKIGLREAIQLVNVNPPATVVCFYSHKACVLFDELVREYSPLSTNMIVVGTVPEHRVATYQKLKAEVITFEER